MNIADQDEDAKILLSFGNGLIVRSDLDLSSPDLLPGKIRLREFQFALAHFHAGHDVLFATPQLLIEGGNFKCCLASVDVVMIVKTKGFRFTVARGDPAARSPTPPRERRHLHDAHRTGLSIKGALGGVAGETFSEGRALFLPIVQVLVYPRVPKGRQNGELDVQAKKQQDVGLGEETVVERELGILETVAFCPGESIE